MRVSCFGGEQDAREYSPEHPRELLISECQEVGRQNGVTRRAE